VLGPEYDDHVRDVLRDVLRALGGRVIDKSWGVGGSQEVETLDVEIDSQRLHVEADTYMGLSIEGPDELVEHIRTVVFARL